MNDAYKALTLHTSRKNGEKKIVAESVPSSSVLPISLTLHNWLQSVGNSDVEVPWIAEHFTIFGAKNFVAWQVGYRISSENHGALLPDWPHQLICIGQVIGDPIMVSCDLSDASVYAAQHGTGRWEPFKIAPNLASFCEALKTWCDLYFVSFKTEILDDTFAVKPEVIQALQTELSKNFSSEEVRGFLKLSGD